MWERTQAAIQEIVNETPKAKRYFNDAYERLWYHWSGYEVSQGKKDTHSVEADNAELRHYLARLARRSRSFSLYPEGSVEWLHKRPTQPTEAKTSMRIPNPARR